METDSARASSTSKTPNVVDSALAVRRSSRVPGAFDTESDLSPVEANSGDLHALSATVAREVPVPSEAMNVTTESGVVDDNAPEKTTTTAKTEYISLEAMIPSDRDDSNPSFLLPPLTDRDDSSLLAPSEDGDQDRGYNQTYIEENEMRRKLMEMESSFLPEPSTIEVAAAAGRDAGVDDTYLVGVPGDDATAPSETDDTQLSFAAPSTIDDNGSVEDQEQMPQTPRLEREEETNLDLDATPAATTEQTEGNTTLLEAIASSPSAAAAARSENRNYSLSFNNGASVIRRSPQEQSTDKSSLREFDDSLQPPSPSKSRVLSRSLPSGQSRLFDDGGSGDGDHSRTGTVAEDGRGNRPKYLSSRQSTHRLSYSSVTSNNTETTNSDATLGADYALQSGGAVPGNPNNSQNAKRNNLARSVSLGSMASGISGYSDENLLEKRLASGATDGGLQTLNEEEGPSPSRPRSSQREPPVEDPAPITPKGKPQDSNLPTDTAITERVKDIQVPGTLARQFRENHDSHGLSPDKRTGAPTPGFARSGRTMTLKEQSSTIDRLSKENFDLKMRIHFLNEALNKRSEEGIKEMISENVELKSDKLKLQKDNQSLKKKIRDLEKQLNDRDQQSDKESMVNHDPQGSEDEDRDVANEEELLFLRERIETYELEIERLRSESIARESEKRRLAEVVKSLSENRAVGSETGSREERDMWKDMLDAETAAREQAEEENKRLRDENLRLKTEIIPTMAAIRPGQRDRLGSVVSYSTTSDRDANRSATIGSSAGGTVVQLELLKQENAELRKEVSAQTSMLTSRNREKERLYQEIEDLKLRQRRDGGRSTAGDSIFDRSASRANARPSSRASNRTATSRVSDSEREDMEIRNGQLRDQVSALRLEKQALTDELDEAARSLDAYEEQYFSEVSRLEEAIRLLTEENQNLENARAQAQQTADERDSAWHELRAQAEEEIVGLDEELRQRDEERQRLYEELNNRDEELRNRIEELRSLDEELRNRAQEVRDRDENLKALEAEIRSLTEGIIRLEEDSQSNQQKHKEAQQELEDSNREIESLERSLFEANSKVQRLTVQIESSQNEIAFLREEQDGDKIKIGDLESELKTYHTELHSEKEKTRELEARLAEERHQREVVGSKEKQEVQRIVNELNREASAAKEEARKLKKNLSAQEIETNTWRERLMDLENNLRETLGDLDGSRSSLISNIMKLQKELESTALELESIRSKLDEKESLLRNRDALLESHGLESRKLAELLERERHARRADKQSFEQALKSHHQASRTITQNNSRISELESARNQDRKRFTNLEQQFRDQLSERNAMLLAIWKRLSTMCGPDWAHSNSLINGNLPSQEVIGNILFWPGFSRNLLLAVKTVESVFSGFKNRIKAVDRDITKQYQALEHTFSLRIKKLERLEEAVKNMRAQQHNFSSSPEIAKLRGENRLLKAELNLLQSHSRNRTSAVAAGMGPNSPRSPTRHEAEPSSLIRHHSASVVEKTGIPQPSPFSSTTTLTNNAGAMVQSTRQGDAQLDNSDKKWIHRLHELERRLKAEREARLLDRSGARKRLEERDAENQKLRAELERERVRRRISTETSTDDDTGHTRRHDSRRSTRNTSEDGRHRDEEPSSSEEEGIYVDIEV